MISNILLVLVHFDRPLENLENEFFEVFDSGPDPGPKRFLVARKLSIPVPFGSYRPTFVHETLLIRVN